MATPQGGFLSPASNMSMNPSSAHWSPTCRAICPPPNSLPGLLRDDQVKRIQAHVVQKLAPEFPDYHPRSLVFALSMPQFPFSSRGGCCCPLSNHWATVSSSKPVLTGPVPLYLGDPQLPSLCFKAKSKAPAHLPRPALSVSGEHRLKGSYSRTALV